MTAMNDIVMFGWSTAVLKVLPVIRLAGLGARAEA